MRTIKFRAYHKFLKKMLIPERLWLDDGMVTAFQAQGDSENVFQVKRDSEDYGLELMQSTGLEDKNGKEIYEGDIIVEVGSDYFWMKDDKDFPKDIYDRNSIKILKENEEGDKFCSYDKVRGVVEWSDTTGYEPFCDSIYNCRCCGGGFPSNKFYVAGNIHENPELLNRG